MGQTQAFIIVCACVALGLGRILSRVFGEVAGGSQGGGHVEVAERSWRGHGEVMERSWRGHGEVMERSRRGRGEVVERSWKGTETHRDVMMERYVEVAGHNSPV